MTVDQNQDIKILKLLQKQDFADLTILFLSVDAIK